MESYLTLQRLRFYEMDPGLVPSNCPEIIRRFNLKIWEDNGRKIYWHPTGHDLSSPIDGFHLQKDQSVSSDTLLNAFFTSHWRKHTRLKSLCLQLEYHGRLLLEIFSHSETGEACTLFTQEIANESTEEFRYSFPSLGDGLRFSFKLSCQSQTGCLRGGAWQTCDSPDEVNLGVIITTRDRDLYAERLVQRLHRDTDLQAEGITTLVIDQNETCSLKHRDQMQHLVVHQENLGVTAGWVRGVMEMQGSGQKAMPTHFLILDDDLDLDSETVLRVIRINQFIRAPSILNGSQLDLCRPDKLLSQADVLQKTEYNYYDVWPYLNNAEASTQNGLNVLSIPSDYVARVARYSCVPALIFSEIGFPAPFFAEGHEDAQFSLRARKRGYPTCAFAGLFFWHLPPSVKGQPSVIRQYMKAYCLLLHNTLHGWEACSAYFLQVGAWAMNGLINHRYQYAATQVLALEDFLQGWSFFASMAYPEALNRVRSRVSGYDANEKPKPQRAIHKSQIVDLKRRLEKAALCFDQKGQDIQKEFCEKIPLTFRAESWSSFLRDRSLTPRLKTEASTL